MTVWHLGTSWIFGLKGWSNCIVYLRHHICSTARLRTVGLQPIGVKLEEWWDESCVCPPCFCHASCVFATTCLSCLRFFGSQIAHLNLVALNWVPRSANLVATSPQGCLSLYSKGGLDIGFGSWQDVDAKKAALLVKSYLSITRGWTKDCVRECKLGRSTNPNRYTPMSSSWCWWVCFLFHACELFSYLGWFGHLFVYLIFIIPIIKSYLVLVALRFATCFWRVVRATTSYLKWPERCIQSAGLQCLQADTDRCNAIRR